MIVAYDFEKEFYKDVREKKRTARGIFSQKGKRGYVGRVLTTVDYLTGKERREYTKSGDITVMNIYKQLLPFEDLSTYSIQQQKEILTQWREVHTQNEIVNALGVNKNIYYKKLYDLGVLERPESEKKKLNAKDKKVKSTYKSPAQGIATADDLVPYGSFRSLPMEEQYYLLDNYYDRFATKSLAESWGKPVSSMHQLRYTLKKYMVENDLSLENEVKKTEFWKKHDRTPTKKPNESVAIESQTAESEQLWMQEEEKPRYDSLLEVASSIEEEKKLEIEQEQKSEEVDEVVSSIVEEKQESEDYAELRALVESQQKLLLEIAEKQKQTETISNEPVIAEAVKRNSGGMNFTFEDEKEGFLLHHDLLQFISVLQKNPNAFHVDIKITKKE